MRILLTHERFPPDFGGGGEYVALETAHHLRRRGVDVRVLTSGDPAITSYEGIPTERLPISRYRLNLALPAIARRATDVDLIQTFTYHACLPSLAAGRRLGKPVVCTILGLFHEVWKEMRGPLLGRAFMAWERYLVSRDWARLVFLSDYSRATGIALGARPERTLVIPIGIELDLYRPALDKERVVLFVGKLDVRKGVLEVLATAGSVSEARFRIVGWGHGEDALRRAAPPNVEFVPFERGPALREHFARASIFLLPSRAEGFPVALLEAMASGCAIISTLPLEFAGIRVPTGDQRALDDAVRGLWSRPDEAARLAARTVELAQDYTWGRYTSTLMDMYVAVLREKHEPGTP